MSEESQSNLPPSFNNDFACANVFSKLDSEPAIPIPFINMVIVSNF